jgi:hypothetical protein
MTDFQNAAAVGQQNLIVGFQNTAVVNQQFQQNSMAGF